MLIPPRQLISPAFHERAVADFPPAASVPGAMKLGTDKALYLSQGDSEGVYRWRKLVTGANDGDGTGLTVLQSLVAVTVGAAGDFSTLGAALAYLSQFTPAAGASDFLGRITILSGTTLAEQVTLRGTDLGWVELVSEDETVDVDVTGFVVPEGLQRCAFIQLERGGGLVIRTHFRRVGTNVTGSAAVNGITGLLAAAPALIAPPYSDDGDGVDVKKAGFSEWDTGMYVAGTSAYVVGAYFDDCVFHGLIAGASASVTASSVIARRAGINGILAASDAAVFLGAGFGREPLVTNARKVDGVDTDGDYAVLAGGKLVVVGAAGVLGKLPEPINTFTRNGVVLWAAAGAGKSLGFIKPESYTVATLPAAADHEGEVVRVTDSLEGSPYLALSDGASWRSIAVDGFKVLTHPVSVTVGAGGDFPDLADALGYLTQFVPLSNTDTVFATVRILSGHSIAKPIVLSGVQLAWVRVVSDDMQVPVLNSAYAPEFEGTPAYYAFFNCLNAGAPQLVTHFVAANDQWNGIFVDDPASPAFGYRIWGMVLRNSEWTQPLFLYKETELQAVETGFSGFSTNLMVAGGSFARVVGDGLNGIFDNARENGLQVQQAEALLRGVTARNAGVFGLYAVTSRVRITWAHPLGGSSATKPADFRRTVGVDGEQDIVVDGGGQIYLDTVPSGMPLGGSNVEIGRYGVRGLVMPETGVASFGGLIVPQSYTVGTLPSASDHVGTQVYVTDGAAGLPIMAFSDGTEWLRCDTRATVSAT